MNMLVNAGPTAKRLLERPVDMMTAGAAPPAAVIGRIESSASTSRMSTG